MATVAAVSAHNWSFDIPKDGYIKSIKVAFGDVLVSLKFTVQEADGAQKIFNFGGRGGNVVQLDFTSQEYITSIDGAYGTWKGGVYVTSLTFNTNFGRTFGPYGYDYDREDGATGVVKFSFRALDNAKAAGFFGYADSYITRIGFYAKTVSPAYA